MEGEATDLTSIDLPGLQNQLIEAVAAANPSGKLPVTFPKSLADVPASTPAQWPGVNGQVQYS